MSLLIGLDLGTTTIKAVLFAPQRGQVTRVASRPTPVSHPQPGWSEHDPQALWQSAAECLRELAGFAQASEQPGESTITGLAISSMAEAGVLVDPAGQPVAPLIAWYDRRSEPQAGWIEHQVDIEQLYHITGQRVSPSFGVTKLLWTRQNMPEAYVRGAAWLPAPAYLLWRLAGVQAVDYSIASRTLMFDQHRLDWSPELAHAFDLPLGLFPAAAPGGTLVGRITPQAAAETGLARGTACVLGGHDHLCAMLASGAHAPGAVTDSTGSASALMLLLTQFLPDPTRAARFASSGYACYASVLKDQFVLKGGLKAAGSALEWLARQLSPESASPDFAGLEAAALAGVGKRKGPLWLPHLIGSGTPEGDRFSRAALVGVQFEHERGDLFRGLLEGLALWTRHNLEEMQSQSGMQIESIRLTGGVTRLRLLSQLKADALNRQVLVPGVPEAAAAGAALLAGLGTGMFRDAAEAACALNDACQQIDPIPQRVAWYDQLYHEVYRPLYGALKGINQALES